MNRKILSLLLTIIMAIAMMSAAAVTAFADESSEATVSTAEADDSRYITITVHAGDNGYFGDSSVKEVTTQQLKGDTFNFDTVPDAADDSLVFQGWSKTPDGTEVEVVSGETAVNSIGTDIYAVWSDKVHVVYRCTEGYVEISGSEYSELIMEYKVGETFRELEAIPNDSQTKFDGWFTGMNGKGTKYTAETIITEPETTVFAKWVLNSDEIPTIKEDTDYPVKVSGSGIYYQFTPSETALYEIYTSDLSGSVQAYIRLLDKDMADILDSTATDKAGNVALCTELTAGQTYYFQLRSLNGSELSYTARLHRPEEATVTFHANRDDAWFDGDHSLTAKDIHLKAGTNIKDYSKSGLEFDTKSQISLWGWSIDPDALKPDDSLLAEDDMDVYAVYHTSNTILLDANGGYFQHHGNISIMAMSYDSGEYFVTDYDPKIDDNSVKFAGWATTPDATEPNVEEGQVLVSDLGDIIYAVYTEKVVVTFDSTEGYMMDDPSITTFQGTFGKGHIFYGMALMHDDSNMTPLAWRDSNGVEFQYTSEYYPFYRIYEDTTFTAVWGKSVIVDANGGYFFDDTDLNALKITFYIDDPFNSDDITGLVGDPNNDGSGKVLLGWATTPDAEVPDVIDGETEVMGLSRIYAVWGNKDDGSGPLSGEPLSGNDATNDRTNNNSSTGTKSIMNGSNNSASSSTTKAAPTGDDSSIAIWTAAALLAVTASIILAAMKHNRLSK